MMRFSEVSRLVASRIIVTPFLPYILSSHFLSEEVYKHGVRALNPRSKDLGKERHDLPESLRVVYCETKLLPTFREEFLPKLRGRFILVSGSLHLPDLDSEFARQLLCELERKSIVWFCHNPPFDSGPPWGFPFGSPYLTSHLTLFWALFSRFRRSRKREMYVPFFRVHPHLQSAAREERMSIKPLMQPEQSVSKYLRTMGKYRCVLSPQGDRADTFRHWESLLVGSFPITTLPPRYREVFGPSMIFATDLKKCGEFTARCQGGGIAPISAGLVRSWRRKLEKVFREIQSDTSFVSGEELQESSSQISKPFSNS